MVNRSVYTCGCMYMQRESALLWFELTQWDLQPILLFTGLPRQRFNVWITNQHDLLHTDLLNPVPRISHMVSIGTKVSEVLLNLSAPVLCCRTQLHLIHLFAQGTYVAVIPSCVLSSACILYGRKKGMFSDVCAHRTEKTPVDGS